MTTARHTVISFCIAHDVVLTTLSDWRPLDPNYTYNHRLFGDVVSGITDGIVAYTHHTTDEVKFVHLDLLTPTAIPTKREHKQPKQSKRPQHHRPAIAGDRRPVERPAKELLDHIFSEQLY